ncbi:hypothetical protein DFS33DRAFT_1280696 [Desarmillaria ectypa]|nr:hypothetical protein DFS33DRAFT_1280696 [Desarmillaria ectypa]
MSVTTPPIGKGALSDLVAVVGIPARSVVVLVVVLAIFAILLSVLAIFLAILSILLAILVIITVIFPSQDVDDLLEELADELVIGFVF